MLAGRVDGMDRAQMRALADTLRNKWKTAVVVLASADDGNVALLTAVTKDLTEQGPRRQADRRGGARPSAARGGGRPDMAEGGGKDPSALPAALEAVYTQVEGLL